MHVPKKSWFLLPLVAVAVLVLAGVVGTHVSQPAQADPAALVELDTDVTTGGVQAVSPSIPVGGSRTMAVTLSAIDAPFGTVQWEVSFDPTELDYVTGSGSHVHPDATICFGFTEGTFGAGPLIGDDFVNSACGVSGGGTSSTLGAISEIDIACVSMGPNPLHLVTTVEDAVSGTTVVGQTTNTSDATVTCELWSDWVITKEDSPDPVLAGGLLTYTNTLHNAGPNPSTTLVVADVVPVEKVVVGTTGVSPACAAAPSAVNCPGVVPGPAGVSETVNAAPSGATCFWFEGFDGSPFGFGFFTNLVICDYSGFILPGAPILLIPSDTVVVTIDVTVPLSDAGKTNANFTLAGDLNNIDPDPTDEPECALLPLPPTPDNSLGCEFTDVSPADVSISKVSDQAQYSEGDTITWTVTLTSNGPSDASDVVISDTVGPNQSLVSATLTGSTATDYDCVETASNAAGIVGSTATCTLDGGGVVPAGDVETMDVVADVVTSVGNECVNNASVQWADPLDASTGDVTVPCFPPTVRMQKDLTDDPLTIVNEGNLWLCEDCPLPGEVGFVQGEGGLLVLERAFNVVNDPDGAGAFEFQIKFDHKIFDISVEETDWLSNGGTRDVTCDMTIITENWILVGCVSSGSTPGQTADGVIALITVLPEPDLKYRLTPGQVNGVFRIILDENCEIADPFGDPLYLEGDVTLAPGILPGGLVAVCDDLAVTVRILEGDLNLDCEVDVLDQQAIAFRYGSIFGMLLYDPWYDLEPSIKDFDIDIKDLQKVWGRDGSTCENPIPDQDPLPFPF